MSMVDVDQDLVAMARRHLEIDSGFLQLKQKVDDLMKRENITADADTIDARMAEWQKVVTTVQADPAMSEKLPEEARRLLEDVFELEQRRVTELREIEIMQAVLQERYPGTKFPLPEVAQ
jgi:site-specific recombinase